jgi:hypothetical protein
LREDDAVLFNRARDDLGVARVREHHLVDTHHIVTERPEE